MERPSQAKFATKSTLALALILPLVLLFLLICEVYDNAKLMEYVNSDTLLPAHLFEFMFHHGFHFGHFQLPRVTSLFPDLGWFYLIQKITDSWRWAFLSLGYLQSLIFLTAGAGILQQLKKTSWPQAFAILSFVASVILFCEINTSEALYHVRLLIEVVAHGGPFVMTLVAVLVLYKSYQKNSGVLLVLLAILSGATFISDRLTFFSFHLPALATLAFLSFKEKKILAAFNQFAAIALGTAFAWYEDTLLRRQQDATRSWTIISSKLLLFKEYFEASMLLKWVLPALLIFLIPLFFVKIRKSSAWQSFAQKTSFQFFQVFTFFSLAMSFTVVVTLLFMDEGSFRYLHPLLWWPLIWFAAYLIQWLGENKTFAIALAGQIVLLVILLFKFSGTPGILVAKSPLAECLLQNREKYHLGSGKADYWNARKPAALSDWQLTIDQIYPDGRPYYWGNDLQAYEDYKDKKPYNFFIIDKIDGSIIYNKYGPPKATFSCPGSDIWVY